MGKDKKNEVSSSEEEEVDNSSSEEEESESSEEEASEESASSSSEESSSEEDKKSTGTKRKEPETTSQNEVDGAKRPKVDNATPSPFQDDYEEKGPTRCFLGNLPFAVTEEDIHTSFKDCGEVMNIQWLTDKTTGKFYGNAFVEFDSATAARKAVDLSGLEIQGRNVRIEFSSRAKTRDGSESKSSALTPQQKPSHQNLPQGCTTLFIGGCPYEIDDEDMHNLFKNDGKIKEIRWAVNKATGDFKGAGFVEFEDEETCEKAIKRNGTLLKGRRLRMDYAPDSKSKMRAAQSGGDVGASTDVGGGGRWRQPEVGDGGSSGGWSSGGGGGGGGWGGGGRSGGRGGGRGGGAPKPKPKGSRWH